MVLLIPPKLYLNCVLRYNKFVAYLRDIKSGEEFEQHRRILANAAADDEILFLECMSLFLSLMKYEYVSSKSWLGLPIVKLPEDIIVIQEFYFEFRPTAVVEVGVARGGGVALALSLQQQNGLRPNVMGIDLKILEHTRKPLSKYEKAGSLRLIEADSTSKEAELAIKDFVQGHEKIFVTLDSNHTHSHVLEELRIMQSVLPAGSVVLVSDGIIEYLPDRIDRPWKKGNSPQTALKQFLKENTNWRKVDSYCRRSIFSEFRDGWIERLH